MEPLLLHADGKNDGNWAAIHPAGVVMIRGKGGWEPWSYDEALALRDWLNRVLGDGLTIADYEEVLRDHRRLVRELDAMLNGDGAARQASLCDIVAQVANNQSAFRLAAAPAQDEQGEKP